MFYIINLHPKNPPLGSTRIFEAWAATNAKFGARRFTFMDLSEYLSSIERLSMQDYAGILKSRGMIIAEKKPRLSLVK